MAALKHVPGRLVRQIEADADAIGVGIGAMLTADLTRYREIAAAAVPSLTDWQMQLLSHVLSGVEAARILSGDDTLPNGQHIAGLIDEWADGAQDDDCLRAGELRHQVVEWPSLTIAGVLMAMREARRE